MERDHWVEVDEKGLSGGITPDGETDLGRNLETEMNMTRSREKSRAIWFE